MREDMVTCPTCDGDGSTMDGDCCGVCLGAGAVVDSPRLVEECDICDGEGWVPCDCDLCRTPVGRACGVMGHLDERCPACGGDGTVPVQCGWCGEDLTPGSIQTEDGAMCPTCRAEALEAA